MAKIKLLPEVVASQVAAGEVVERPASVLKELLENSLDSGANRIDVEFARGGVELIRVRDDGGGMEREDALLSLERHATSKIRTGADLEAIQTFGFRGEALPSIASVSRFHMLTRPATDEAGTEITVEGGKLNKVEECGGPAGTTITVRSLFFNLPARRKFLRTEITESSHLVHQMHTVALAHPEVSFSLRKDGRLLFQLAPAVDLRVRIRDLLGGEWFEQLQSVPALETRGIRVSGLLARPGFSRMDRSGQFVFLNRRPVTDAAIAKGLREGLAGTLDGRAHPVAVLFLEMEPSAFDCNVHPAKREIRFHRPDAVRDAVAAFVREGFRPASPQREVAQSPESRLEPSPPAVSPPSWNPILPQAIRTHRELPLTDSRPESAVAIHGSQCMPDSADPTTGDMEEKSTSPADEFQLRGSLGSRYQIFESKEGLVLLDVPHALERIFYEQLSGATNRQHPAQRLLPPVTLSLDPRDYSWVLENTVTFSAFGFQIENFGANVVKIESVPAGMESWNTTDLLLRLLDEIRTGAKASARRFLHDQMALGLCRMRAQRADSRKESPLLVLKKLFACELPYASPSGKPTVLQIGWNELERKFQR